MQFHKIVYATDYSKAADYAFECACSLARAGGALLIITHVSHTEEYPVGELVDEEPHSSPQEVQRLQALVPRDARIRHEHRLLHAQPPGEADRIVDLADKEGADLIVLGIHGRSGLTKMLAGSVAESVLRKADCPVVTVKQPEPKQTSKPLAGR